MKKTLSIILSFVMVLTMLPLTVFGADIESIEYKRREPVVAYYETNGEWRDGNDDEEQFFYYFGIVGYGSGDMLTVHYNDGSSSVYMAEYDDEGFKLVNEDNESDVIRNITTRDTQQQTHWKLGDDNYYYINYAGYTAAVQVSVVINPVTAIAFRPANSATYIEHANGEWRGEGDDRYFEYNVPGFQEGDELDVTYRETGETVTYTYSSNGWEFYDDEGNELPDSDTELFTTHEGENVWQVGSDNNYYYVRYRNVLSNKIYVSVIENPVSGIAFEKKTPVTYIEGTHMYHDNWDNADYYDSPVFELGDKLTVYDKKGGSTVYTFYYDEENEYSWNGRFVAEGKDDISQNDVRIETRQNQTPWTLGENKYTVEYAGFSYELTATITENPVASIAITKANDVVLFEGNTYYDNWDDAYYYSDPWFEDGDILTVTDNKGGSIEYVYGYNEKESENLFTSKDGAATISPDDITIRSNQRTTPWELGSDNECTVEYMGRTATFNVTIIKNPVTSISFTRPDNTMFAESGGYESTDSNGEEFYYYWLPWSQDGDSLTVVYNDGRGTVTYTAQRDDNDELVYVAPNGATINQNEVSFGDNQNEEHWTAGGDNYYTVTYMGATCTCKVNIIVNPVKSIAFKPVNPAVYTEGEQRYDETDDRYYFDLPQICPGDVFTVEYSDERGTVDYTAVYDSEVDKTYFKDENSGDIIDPNDYETFERYHYQRMYAWTVDGWFNYYYIEYSGRTCEVPVTVKENNVKSISITLPRDLVVYASDTTTEPDENGAVYEHYNIPNLEDGTVLTITDKDGNDKAYTLQFNEEDGERYFTAEDGDKIHFYALGVSHNQALFPWTVGGTNTFTATYLGASCSVPVTLVSTDVESISFIKAKPIVLTEYEGGEWKYNDQGERFYEYRAELGAVGDVLTIKYKNGSTASYTVDFDPIAEAAHLKASDGSELDVNEVDVFDNQWVEPWLAGEDNFFTVKFHGVSYSVPVTVNHDYKTVVTKATLTKNGKSQKVCAACGDVESTTTIYFPKTFKLSATSYTYDGKVKKPTVTVTDSKGKKISASNYTVTYSSNKAVGTATAKITFKGNYSGTKSLTFTINPKATSLKKVTAGKKSFTATWNKQATQTTGYEIQYSLKSNFSGAKTYNVKKNTTTKATVKSLKAKKKYYVRIRTYKTVGKKKYYSSWSKTITVKTN